MFCTYSLVDSILHDGMQAYNQQVRVGMFLPMTKNHLLISSLALWGVVSRRKCCVVLPYFRVYGRRPGFHLPFTGFILTVANPTIPVGWRMTRPYVWILSVLFCACFWITCNQDFVVVSGRFRLRSAVLDGKSLFLNVNRTIDQWKRSYSDQRTITSSTDPWTFYDLVLGHITLGVLIIFQMNLRCLWWHSWLTSLILRSSSGNSAWYYICFIWQQFERQILCFTESQW